MKIMAFNKDSHLMHTRVCTRASLEPDPTQLAMLPIEHVYSLVHCGKHE